MKSKLISAVHEAYILKNPADFSERILYRKISHHSAPLGLWGWGGEEKGEGAGNGR